MTMLVVVAGLGAGLACLYVVVYSFVRTMRGFVRTMRGISVELTQLETGFTKLQDRQDAADERQDSNDERLGALGQLLLEVEVDLQELDGIVTHDIELLAKAHNSVAVRVLGADRREPQLSATSKKDLPS